MGSLLGPVAFQEVLVILWQNKEIYNKKLIKVITKSFKEPKCFTEKRDFFQNLFGYKRIKFYLKNLKVNRLINYLIYKMEIISKRLAGH